ncbi:MAG: DUF4129 domain-containing protein [Desulfobacteraceae bacterium]|jgi:hypothetical protein
MKSEAEKRLLIGFRIAAEASWVLGLAGFSLYIVSKWPFPLFWGLIVFLASAGFTRGSMEKGWRRISLLAIHLGGTLASLSLIGLADEGSRRFLFSLLKGETALSPSELGLAWIGVLLTGFWTVVLWLKGSALARRPATYERVCSQFDRGVACWGLVFLAGALARVRWGVNLAWGPSVPLFALFFWASVLTMGMASPEAHGSVDPKPFQGLWTLTGFSFLILGTGAGIVLFAMPFLQQGTQLAFHALKETTSPLGPVLVRCLRFLLAHRSTPPDQGPSHPGGGEGSLPQGGAEAEIGLLEEVLGWGLTGFLVAVLVTVLGAVVLLGLKTLLGRSGPRRSRVPRKFSLVAWLKEWIRLFRALSVPRLIQTLKDPGPVRLYSRLAVWGKHSGLPKGANETPSEYGRKLSSVFISLSREIERIVGLVNREVYGDASPAQDERREGRRAWKRLRSPRYWPMRVRVWVRGERMSTRVGGTEPGCREKG